MLANGAEDVQKRGMLEWVCHTTPVDWGADLSHYFAPLRRFIYYSLRAYSLFYFKYCLFCVYIYIYKFICF